MKRLLFLPFVFVICSSFGKLVIDEYSVIKVIGGIKHSNNNKSLFTGDKVFSNERLKFEQESSKAALISKQKGRFMLQASKSGVVNESLMPALNNVSSRAGALLNKIDLENHFKDKYLFLSSCTIQISKSSFPQDKNHFFFVRFLHKGEEISKKLDYNEDNILFDVEEIQKIDGKKIRIDENTQFTLFYYDSSTEKATSLEIATFIPVFIDEADLIKECKLILSELNENASPSEKKEELLAYLTENYGKPNHDNFKNWTKQHLSL